MVNKKKKKLTQKQIDILSMADNELASELYPYLDELPLAKLGLDPQLFEEKNINKLKQKLLNIKTNYKEWKELPENKYTRVSGTYAPSEDAIKINKRGNFYYTSPDETGSSYLKEGREGQIATLIHELRHRGGAKLNRLKGYERRSPLRFDDEWDLVYGDKEIAKKLNHKYIGQPMNKRLRSSDESFLWKGLHENNLGRILETIKENPEVFRLGGEAKASIPRYPSIVKAKGGQINNKKRRKAKPRGVGKALKGYGKAMK